jgi:N-ethylmaleimide reductase
MTTQPLLQPIDIQGHLLPNRVVMAPLTRGRAENVSLEPGELQATYYAQRAGARGASLIISEGTWISEQAIGWADVPGLYTSGQVAGWRTVTDAVHAKGGTIFAQLWHTGSTSHPSFFEGTPPLAPSAVNPQLASPTASGRQPTVTPREMSREDIKATVRDFRDAAQRALDAGFDGVQLQAGYLYLFNQFLTPRTNQRTDEYGGSVENRARFLFEVIEALSQVIDLRRVGVKAGPATGEQGIFVSHDDTIPTSDYVIARLDDYPLHHLLMMGAMSDLTGTPAARLQGDEMFKHYRAIYRGTIIGNVGIDQDRANHLIEAGLVDMVAFGRSFIANPDLAYRFSVGAQVLPADPKIHYGGGGRGYTDFPNAS